ncbi:MAG: hypothetical protein M3Y88_00960 [Chloroflexota bacterium]|nr:hypothetical protein [Chloroflexota bacterium]
MSFWNWRRGGASAAGAAAAGAVLPELAPIELYTADARIVGWIEAGGRRVTDLLNELDELRLWHPSPGPLQALSASATRDPGDWQVLPAASVLLAMPPEWRASRQLRLHRRLRRVGMVVGPFSVTGNLHLPPGIEPGVHVLRAHRFLPLTDAYLLHNGEPSFEHVVSVVIVNARQVEHIVPLVALA